MLGKRLPSDLLSAEMPGTSTCHSPQPKSAHKIGLILLCDTTKTHMMMAAECTVPTTPVQKFVFLTEEVPELSLDPSRDTEFRLVDEFQLLFEQVPKVHGASVLSTSDSWEASSPVSNWWKQTTIHPATEACYTGKKSKTLWKASISSAITCASDELHLASPAHRPSRPVSGLGQGVVFEFMRSKTAAKQTGSLLKRLPL